jgi:ABC-type uncharacterized transport system permease subunit
LRIFPLAVAIFYAAVFAVYIDAFVAENNRMRRAARVVVVVAIALHAAWLVWLALSLRHPPVTNVYEALSSLALVIVVLFLYIDARAGEKSIGVIVFPVVTVMQAVSAALIRFSPSKLEMAQGLIPPLHIYLALMGYAAFALAFICSLTFLLLDREIRSGRFGKFFRLFPSLEELDEMNHHAVMAGLALLLASILLGFAWSYKTFNALPFTDAKVMFTIFTWVVYVVVIAFKYFYGWQGRRSAILSVCGFALIMMSFSVINGLVGSFHAYF